MQGNLNELMQVSLNDLVKDLPPDIARHVARVGVKLAIDLLQTLYSDLGTPEETVRAAKKRLGRPPKMSPEEPVRAGKRVSGWSDDPEERSREMLRRREVRAAKARRARISAGAKRRWQEMSKAERAERLRNMQRGKAKNRRPKKPAQVPVVSLQEAS
jgi:hypothetical protein